MGKINKLALVRLALRQTLSELDTKELLCILADMYAPPMNEDGTKNDSIPRWYGNGSGTSGLEQGIYNYMTTFRRVSNLWSKILKLTTDQKQEVYNFRDFIVTKLTDRGTKLDEIQDTDE
jgi:hypothetical protein